MLPSSSTSRPWCEAWDRASDGLLTELSSARPHPLRVREFIDRRQRLMTADPRPTESERTPADAQARWLVRAVDREAHIQDLFERYRDVVAQSLRTFQAGGRTRQTYQTTIDVAPGRNLDRTT